MFRKTNSGGGNEISGKPASRKEVPSIISSDFNLLGNIISDGLIDFDGKINGNIQCSSLVVRKNAIINGEVLADNVQIYGRINGLVRAKHVSLFPSCNVEGTVMHETISIADGAVIDGNIKRTDKLSSIASYDSMESESEATPRLLENFRIIGGTSSN